MEQQLMNLIFNAPNYNTFKEIHNKYYNLLLGKMIPVSYKSLEFMFKDFLRLDYYMLCSKTILNFDVVVSIDSKSRAFFKVTHKEINYSHNFIIIDSAGNIPSILLNRINALFNESC